MNELIVILIMWLLVRVLDKSLTLNIKNEQNESSDTQNSVLFAFLSNLSILKCHNKEFLKSKSFCPSLKKTTRYAGARRRLYPKNSDRDTIKVFKSIVKRKEKNMAQKAHSLSHTKWHCSITLCSPLSIDEK